MVDKMQKAYTKRIASRSPFLVLPFLLLACNSGPSIYMRVEEDGIKILHSIKKDTLMLRRKCKPLALVVDGNSKEVMASVKNTHADTLQIFNEKQTTFIFGGMGEVVYKQLYTVRLWKCRLKNNRSDAPLASRLP